MAFNPDCANGGGIDQAGIQVEAVSEADAKIILAQGIQSLPRGTAPLRSLLQHADENICQVVGKQGAKAHIGETHHLLPLAEVVEEKLCQAAIATQRPAKQVDPGDDGGWVSFSYCQLAFQLGAGIYPDRSGAIFLAIIRRAVPSKTESVET